MESKEVVVNGPSLPDLIKLAIEKGQDLSAVEKLLKLKAEYEAQEARKAYNIAMAAFKANAPKIDKDKTVAYGNTKYSHATLANVTEKISGELSKHGLSASWSIQQNGQISVTCTITHVKGHSEATTLSAQADSSGSKNSIQAIGSTLTYLERYTILALTGLATFDQDDDGAGATEYINEDQRHQIVDLMAAKNIKEAAVLQYAKIESLDKLPKASFDKVVAALNHTQAKAVSAKAAK